MLHKFVLLKEITLNEELMSESESDKDIVWNPQMPDRRKNDRRDTARNVQPNGQQMNIANEQNNNERRRGRDRRKKVTVTITGRAMDVEQGKDNT